MATIVGQALQARFTDPRSVRGIWLLRYLVPIAALAALLLLREPGVTGASQLIGIPFIVILYNTAVGVLMWRGAAKSAATLAAVLDVVSLFAWIMLLALKNTPGDLNLELLELTAYLAAAASLVHFGLVVGGTISLAMIGMYLSSYHFIAGSPEGLTTGLVHTGGSAVTGLIIAWIVYDLRHDQALLHQRQRELHALNRLYIERIGPILGAETDER